MVIFPDKYLTNAATILKLHGRWLCLFMSLWIFVAASWMRCCDCQLFHVVFCLTSQTSVGANLLPSLSLDYSAHVNHSTVSPSVRVNIFTHLINTENLFEAGYCYSLLWQNHNICEVIEGLFTNRRYHSLLLPKTTTRWSHSSSHYT